MCIHREACGACALMHLGYTEQLATKRARVSTSVARHLALAPLSVAETRAAEPRSGYRTRAKVMVASDARVGLFGAHGDHQVVDTPGCIVLSPLVSRVIAELRERVREDTARGGALAPADVGAASRGGLLAIDVREARPLENGMPGEAQALVTLVVARGTGVRLEAYRAAAVSLMAAVTAVVGVALNFHDGESPQVLGKETLVLAGRSSVQDTVGTTGHRATFGSFVQAHRGQAAKIHAAIANEVLRTDGEPGGPARVLDLYGGSGAIALSLAVAGADVTMVESFGPAVQEAMESARAAGVRVVAERADVAVALASIIRRGRVFDAAVVNPPRRGLDPEVRKRLAACGLTTIVYVSCQPETLARDLDHLARLGFAARELIPFDMIPMTEEVETVAVLRRAPPTPPTVLYEDAEVVVIDKTPHEPTTPQGEHDTSLLVRVQALRGAERAVPVHRLDVGTSGVVVFAKDPSHVAAWSDAIQANGATKTYVAAVRGVPSPSGLVDRPLVIEGRSKSARTRYRRTDVLGAHAILEVEPEEGRTHQIRRHLAAIGHPVLGDERYGHASTNRFFFEKHGLDRTFLHAARLSIVHPRTRKPLVIVSPLPGDLATVVSRAGATKR